MFRENDSTVVCPICGTPHHRGCYLKENKCGVEAFHLKGFVWNGNLPGEEPPTEQKESDEYYGDDHSDPVILDFLKRVSDSTVGDDGVSMKELTVFVSRSLYHYELAFRLFRGSGKQRKKRKLFFNVCSGLLAPTFQFYRKMDVLGIILIVAMLIPSVLYALNRDYFQSNIAMYNLLSIFSFTEQVLLCVFGDYLYYRHAVKKILKIRGEFKDNENSGEYYEALREAGQPSLLRAIVGTLAFVFATSLILLIPGAQ